MQKPPSCSSRRGRTVAVLVPFPSNEYPYFFVPNNIASVSNVGKPGQRDTRASRRRRRTRAETRQGVCCFALRPLGVTLEKVSLLDV